MRSTQRVGLLVVCLLFFVTVAAAASTTRQAAKAVQSGDIHGVVNYCKPGRVTGTLVHIPGRIFQSKLGPSGEFTLNYVPPGSYSLTIEIPSSVPQTVTGITVRDNEITEAPPIQICNDNDGDGYAEDVDCDDNNPAIHPGVFEGCNGPDNCVACDGVDNNCNGVVDEGCPNCTDADHDGFCAQVACSGLTSGSVTCLPGVDCNDQDATISPAQAEICDGKDNNCDKQIDEGFDLTSDANNCGKCGIVCPIFPTAWGYCDGGNCAVICNPGWQDCNHDPADGCESDYETDDNNCMRCGNVCPQGTRCNVGTCE